MMKRAQLKNDGHVRLSHELSEDEKKATGNRKVKVQKCLNSLGIACDKDNMSNIAVLGSGGGLRAMIALQGTLVELKNQGLLDAILYLCGVSGSTWCMSTLYQKMDWTHRVQQCEEDMCRTLSEQSCDIHKEISIAIKAAEDEFFSLTDIWTAFFVCSALKRYDETKLSEQKGASTNGINPYPIYAAIEANKLGKAGENCPGTWVEFTPHESGFPGLGAFVSTEYLGSKFKDGNLQENREEKSICYMRGLWGSALSSLKQDFDFLRDFLLGKFRELREYLQKPGGLKGLPSSVLFLGTDCTCAYCRGVFYLLELHAHASAGKDCRAIFTQLKEILKEQNSKKSHLKCCKVSETWHLKNLEERSENFSQLIGIFEEEHRGTDCTNSDCQSIFLILKFHAHSSAGKDCRGIIMQLKEVLKEEHSKYSNLKFSDVSGTCHLNSWVEWTWEFANLMWIFIKELGGYALRIWQLLRKTVICLCFWTWGYTSNFLYTADGTQSTGLTNEEFIYLIDAGLGINCAYPLVLRPERKVNLILSFDFSAGDPFETIGKTAQYCETNHIPFPKIDSIKPEEKGKPRDCYIFKGKDVPTVIHFPLFNTKNCGDKIESFRNKYSTFKLSYSKNDIEELLRRAKMNVSNNREKILKEIAESTKKS